MHRRLGKENVLRAFLWFGAAALLLQVFLGVLVVYLFQKWEERSHFGSMFGVASCLFSGLALAGIILSLRFQADELAVTREDLSRQFRMTLVRNVMAEMDQREVHLARNRVYRDHEQYAAVDGDPLKLRRLDQAVYEQATVVANSFDRVGVLVCEDEPAKKVVLQCFGPSIARSWVALEPVIQALRKGRYGPEHESFFEALAREAIGRLGRDQVEAMLRIWADDARQAQGAPVLHADGTAQPPANEDSIARHEQEVAGLEGLPLDERRAYWDAFYGSAESRFLSSDDEVGRFGVIAELISRQPGSIRVLDVGCGTGGLCALLPPHDEYLGIDISRTAIAQASAAHPGRDFAAASLEGFAADDGPFDFVVLSEMLFYVDQLPALQRAADLLRAGTGRLIVSIYASPSGDALLRLLRERLDVLQEIQIQARGARLAWHVLLARPSGGDSTA